MDAELQKRSSALFLLKLKERHQLSQVAIDDIVEGSRLLYHQTSDRIHAGIDDAMAQEGVELQGLDGIFEDLTDPFSGLET